MDSAPKQERSKKRIQTILETAEAILLEENVDAITIAKISKLSGLKRTSTYKFFQTPDSIKTELVKKYFIEYRNKKNNYISRTIEGRDNG